MLKNYTMDLSCGQDYTISSAIAMGGTIDSAKKSINTANCISFSNKMNLNTDFCNLLTYFDKKIIDSNCLGKKSCSISIELIELVKNCGTENKLFDTLYSSYSCYGK